MFDQLPESSTGGHLSAPKIVAASVCGILLSFGLCGADAYFFRNGYGGVLSVAGAALFVVSVVVLVLTLFVLIAKATISLFTKK